MALTFGVNCLISKATKDYVCNFFQCFLSFKISNVVFSSLKTSQVREMRITSPSFSPLAKYANILEHFSPSAHTL